MSINEVQNDFKNVKVQIGASTREIKVEKGCLFENNGGKYLVDNDGKLNVFDKNTNTWKTTNSIKMTNYQMKAFEAVANNSKEGQGIILSKKDIELAQQKFKQGGFTKDMSEFLPNGYKIEKPKMSSAEKYVQAYVTNGKATQSATLKFQIAEISQLKEASNNYQKNTKVQTKPKIYEKNGEKIKDEYNSDGTLKKRSFVDSPNDYYLYSYKNNKLVSAQYYSDGVKFDNIIFDTKGNITKVTSRSLDTPDEEYKYDNKNRLIEARLLNEEGYKKLTYTPSGKISTLKTKYGEFEQTIVFDYSKSKNGQPSSLTRKSSKVADNGNQEYIELSDINYYPDGKVKSYTCITNTTNAHESIDNYEITDNYFAARVKFYDEDNVYPIISISGGGYVDNKNNYKHVLNKPCNIDGIDMDIIGAWYIQSKQEEYITHSIAKP